MSKPQSTNGSESEFEFIETPKAPTPSLEKFEECGVRTTSVRLCQTCPALPCPALTCVLRAKSSPPVQVWVEGKHKSTSLRANPRI